MRSRLSDDHNNADMLARGLAEMGYAVEDTPRRTNMVYFKAGETREDAEAFVKRCAARGLLLGASGPGRVRMVTHLGVDGNSAREALSALKDLRV
jgi:threonine aldolase